MNITKSDIAGRLFVWSPAPVLDSATAALDLLLFIFLCWGNVGISFGSHAAKKKQFDQFISNVCIYGFTLQLFLVPKTKNTWQIYGFYTYVVVVPWSNCSEGTLQQWPFSLDRTWTRNLITSNLLQKAMGTFAWDYYMVVVSDCNSAGQVDH